MTVPLDPTLLLVCPRRLDQFLGSRSATIGDKIVVDFRWNGRVMGEEIRGSDPLHFTAYMKSQSPIVSAEVVSGEVVVLSEQVGSSEASYTWEVEDPGEDAYFYLRLTAANGERTWSRPIFVVP